MAVFQVFTTGYTRTIKRVQSVKAEAHKTARATVKRNMIAAVKHGRERYLTGGTTADRLAVRTGRLRNAFWYSVNAGDEFKEAHLGFIQGPRSVNQNAASPLVYARLHEYGGVIRPVRAKFLTIPTVHAMTPAGVVKGKARDFPNTWVAPGARSPFVILQRQGSSRHGRVVPLFVLVKSVRIPKRPTLAPTWSRFRPIILTDLRRDIPQAVVSKDIPAPRSP